MEDFMLLVKGDGSAASPEEMQLKLQKYGQWMGKWQETGHYVSGAPFQTSGYFLSGGAVHAEGDFLNPNETIGGYIHIKAKDISEAKDIALECPLLNGCGIYVRPFLKM